jgi:L-aspartate oxidase
MSQHCGVERSETGLTALLCLIDDMRAEHGEADSLVAARFIVTGALRRTESRGGHFRTDCPQTEVRPAHTRLVLADLVRQDPIERRYQTPAE